MGKYVHKFNTVSEKELAYHGPDYLEPWLSYTVENDAMGYNKTEDDLLIEKPLTFEVLSDGNIEFASKSYSSVTWSLSYKKNNENWSEQLNTFTISVIKGDVVQFKGINAQLNDGTNKAKGFKATASFNVYGNSMSLSYGDDFIGKTESVGSDFCKLFSGCSNLIDASKLILPITNIKNSCYSQMFMNCGNLITAPELPATSVGRYGYGEMFAGCTSLAVAPKLPATTLNDYCYYAMFRGCTSLTTAPELPATYLAPYCYYVMFNGCTGLTISPELPATTLANYCYQNMFSNCTSLTIAQELPATTLATGCYASMFYECTSLTTAPELPATTLVNSCYSSMFQGCTGLTTAPELPAITLATSCYASMFYNCTNLSYIKAMFTTTPSSNYTTNWVSGVASAGTFVKNANAAWTTTGVNGIPTGWTVETASE